MREAARSFDGGRKDEMATEVPVARTMGMSAAVNVAPIVSERVVLLALFSAVVLVAIVTITPWPVGAFQDDAIYTILAKSLAEGTGYRMINLPGEPNATHFPPGYPMVLAVLWRIWPSFPDNIVLFKFANALFLGAAAVGTFVYVRARLQWSTLAATICAVVGTLSIVVLLVTGVIMSEPLFLALLFPTLLASERAADSGTTRDAFVAGLWIGALGLVRTLGVFAVPAAGLVLLFKRRYMAAVVLGVGAAILLAPWQAWVMLNEGDVPAIFAGKYGSYGQWLIDGYRAAGDGFWWRVILRNLQDLDATLSFQFLPVQATWPRAVAFLAMTTFAALGLFSLAKRAAVTAIFVVMYMAVVLVWPFEPTRFVLAVWPLWWPIVALGVLTLWNVQLPAAPRVVLRSAVAVVAFTLVGGVTWYNVTGYSRRWWASVQRDAGERAKPTVEWVARYTRPTDVLVTDDDLMVYLYTSRQAVPTSTFTVKERLVKLTPAEDLQAVRDIFAHYDGDYFIAVSTAGIASARELTQSNPPMLRVLGHTPHAQIFQRIRQ
jgi:hypothetical protein